MRVYRVEFKGMAYEFDHALQQDAMVNYHKFCTAEQAEALALNESVTLSAKDIPHGWDVYETVTITAWDSESYTCNCCQTEQPGDGYYDICAKCGWENEPGEDAYPNVDGGPNHIPLNEGRANYLKHGHYKCKKGCGYKTCMCDW